MVRTLALLALVAACTACRGAAPLPRPGSILVAGDGTGALQLYDAPSLLPLSRLRLPGPALAAAPAIPAAPGTLALLLGPPANALQEIELRHFSLRRRLPLNFQPSALLSAAPDTAYVAGTDSSGWGWVAQVDLRSYRLAAAVRVGHEPVSLALTPDHAELLVADAATNSVHILNAASLHRTARLALPFSPRQVLALPFGHQAFALGPTQVAAFDWSRAGLLCLLPIGASPEMMLLKPDGGELYVSNAAGTISVLDTSTDVVSATLAAGAGASGLAVSPSGANLYVANSAAG
ncbi:MAG: YncE family protein, partial [Terriglobales bacterium]